MKAIRLCLNRFDVDTKTSFMDLYTKIDAEANAPVVANTETSTATTDVSLEEKIKQANEIVF